jgi:hypothetical protein
MAKKSTHRRCLGMALMMVAASVRLSTAQADVGAWHVVLCSGVLRETETRQAEARTRAGLSSFFTDRLGVSREAVDILCDQESPAFGASTTACTRENLRKALDALASNVRPFDRFIFYYTGQANRAADTLRLNVRGPDVVHGELVQWLGAIKARQKLIILDCPCAGLAIKDLADPHSIIICTARADQYDSPKFSEYFVPALLSWEADGDADGRLSLLDAFQSTSRALDAYYAQENCYRSENALLEDDGDGVPSQQPWLFQQSAKDGARAAQFTFEPIRTAPSPRGQ